MSIEKTLTFQEFGNAVEVSKQLIGDEPLPTKCGTTEYLEATENMRVVMDMLNANFQMAKVKYFPNWDKAECTIKEGPGGFRTTIVRKDGDPVPEDVYDAWYAWYYWNEYDPDKPAVQPTFTYPEEYTTRRDYYRTFCWYTYAPVEEVSI